MSVSVLVLSVYMLSALMVNTIKHIVRLLLPLCVLIDGGMAIAGHFRA